MYEYVKNTKKVTFFYFVILFFIYFNFVSGWPLLGKTKDKSKDDAEIPWRHTRLEKAVEVNRYGKKQKEAFLALATYPLGFMNTDTKQASFIERFLTEYYEYKIGFETYNKKIKKLFESTEPWCEGLLREPVLRDNKILYKPEKNVSMRQLKKVVHFDYFSKEDEVHEVIECPVLVRDQKVMIYFSNLGFMEAVQLTYYFILTAYKPNDNSKLKVLMRTEYHRGLSATDINENDFYHKYKYDLSEVGQIRLDIKPERFQDNYRFFGKKAEAAFILTSYGFWNPSVKPNVLYKFIETTLTLSKGYEIERRKLKSKVIKREGEQSCETRINKSRLFKTYDIKYDAARKSEVTTVRRYILSFIDGIPNPKFKFISCPVTKGSKDGSILLHPIYYKDSRKFSHYDLFWFIASEGEYMDEEVLLFLAPNKNESIQKPEDTRTEIVE